MHGARIESVSMGKGEVRYKVVMPPLKKRPRALDEDYADLTSACVAVKRFFLRDEVDPDTATQAEERDPTGAWGSDRASV